MKCMILWQCKFPQLQWNISILPAMLTAGWQKLVPWTNCFLGYQTWSRLDFQAHRLTEHTHWACPWWCHTCGTRSWHRSQWCLDYRDWSVSPSVLVVWVWRTQCKSNVLREIGRFIPVCPFISWLHVMMYQIFFKILKFTQKLKWILFTTVEYTLNISIFIGTVWRLWCFFGVNLSIKDNVFFFKLSKLHILCSNYTPIC